MSFSSSSLVTVVVLCSALIWLVTGNDKIPSNSTLVIAPPCSDKCGNVAIPYPFGIEDGCYYYDDPQNPESSSFKISCNDSTNNLLTPYFADIFFISKISIEEGEVHSSSYASFDCYNQTRRANGFDLEFWDTTFTLSRTKNILVAIGCDTRSRFSGVRAGKPYETGCISTCVDPGDVVDGDCSGVGCCQASIPDGVNGITVTVSSDQNQSLVNSLNPCRAAFPIAKDALKFDKTNLSHDSEYYDDLSVPIVFSWTITGQGNCTEAKANGSLLCGQNAECYDAEPEVGYRCRCNPGFSGNPYLHLGCQDVDECNRESNCEKAEYCTNTLGSFYCKCPKGYHGTGTKTDRCVSNMKRWFIPVLTTAGVGASLGTTILLLVGWRFQSFLKRRQLIKQQQINFEKNGGMLLQQQMSADETIVDRIKIFTINELKKATDNFSQDRVLGQGGHGTVYKGMLGEGRIVAVKKSNILEESQLEEFINEVVVMSQISHRSILKLLGCCLETEVPLLVYEFIPNGTLSEHIHNPSGDFPITWKMRLQIASDIAGALAYLHSSMSTLIFHRDIKSSNILLDHKYRAKLSDFGTSRSVAVDQTHVVTRVMGTLGYLDPEYFQSQQFTEKSDVYSFGVVLVELLTGEKAVRAASEQDRSLTSWFLSHMENSCVLDIVDSLVLQEGSKKELLTIAELAMRCLRLEGKKRPPMKEVLLEIEAVLSVHMPQTYHDHPNNTPKIDHAIANNIPKIENASDGTPTSTQFSTFSLESRTLDSAELSLLFNPR